MPVEKIGYGGAPSFTPMQMALAPNETFPVPFGQGVVGTFGSLASQFTGFTLSGQYYTTLGPYLSLQQYDSNIQTWRNVHAYSGGPHLISSDGTNYRIANLTGCPVGAVITNAGSGYTNGFNTLTSIVASAGGSTWNSIVGGAVNTTISFSGAIFTNVAFSSLAAASTATASAGSLYTKPPLIIFNPPSNQGSTPYILPTAVCTITSGAIATITVTNQGAGLVALPSIQVINQPGDTTGGGAVIGWLIANNGMVGSGTITWLGVNSPGNTGAGLTAVPTLTFTPASTTAATVIMNFVLTGVTATNAGVAYPTATTFSFVVGGATTAGAAANTNPNYDKLWIMPRVAQFSTSTGAGTTFTTTITINDAGFGWEAVPSPVFPSYVGASTQAILTPTVGGINDFFSIQPI